MAQTHEYFGSETHCTDRTDVATKCAGHVGSLHVVRGHFCVALKLTPMYIMCPGERLHNWNSLHWRLHANSVDCGIWTL